MKHLFCTILGLGSLGFAWSQVADNIPSQGLIFAAPLNGSAAELVSNDLIGIVESDVIYVLDDSLQREVAEFNDFSSQIEYSAVGPQDEVTVALWVQFQDFDDIGQVISMNNGRMSIGFNDNNESLDVVSGTSFQSETTQDGIRDFFVPNVTFENQWRHITATFGNDSTSLFVDGQFITSGPSSESPFDTNILIGNRIFNSNVDYNFGGLLRDVFMWDRILGPDEILDVTQPHPGCMDETACNFDLEANVDDGSCDYSCCPGPGCCDAGMHWDWQIGMCQVTNPSDSNFDGCVQLSDLLDLLGAYGDCSVLDETETVLADSVLHNGQWYGLVTIGNQVWFAENLNTAEYNNGDAIDGVCGQEEWFNGQMASQNVYGDCGLTVYDGVSDLEENEAIYGRLYNVWAVSDERGICPSGYRVSTNDDWSYIIEVLGGEEEAAAKMRTTGIWEENTGLWETSCSNSECFPNNSTNDSGLAIQPGGFRGYNGWLYAGQRRAGIFMTGTLAGPAQPVIRRLDSSPVITQSIVNQYWGASVRCVADAE